MTHENSFHFHYENDVEISLEKNKKKEKNMLKASHKYVVCKNIEKFRFPFLII